MQLESIEIQKQPVDTEDFQQLDVDFPITSAVDKSSVTSSSQKAPIVCSGCNKMVNDASFLFVDKSYWHDSCLKCCACAESLDSTCFVRNGSFYCRKDYQSLIHARACGTCGMTIRAHEFMMRVRNRVYHASHRCFCCFQCERPLLTGDRFLADSKSLLCWECLQPLLHSNSLNEALLNKSGRPKKRKLSVMSQRPISQLPISLSFDEELHSANERQGFDSTKPKRVRTSFKHHQLNAMKAYFDSNHNPDAKDLKQLAHETGLTKRVLQVWFQNARAKYRRDCLQSERKSGLRAKNDKGQLDEKKSDSCVDLSCSDSLSSVFESSPVSGSTSDENRHFYEDPDSDHLTSYSDYPQNECAEGQPMENVNRSLASFHTSSPTSSLALAS